jgi:cysteinyl-tRNA synthetase
MDNDFNTAGATASLNVLVTALNRLASAPLQDPSHRTPGGKDTISYATFKHSAVVLRMLSNILGLFWAPPAKKELGGGDQLVSGLMQLLLDLRNNLRATAKEAAKENPLKKALFDQTDLIRKRLAELGVTLEDRPGGTTWRVG